MGKAPYALHESKRALNTSVRPLQRLLWGRRKYYKKARGVGAILIDNNLWIHAIIFRLGHFFCVANNHWQAIRAKLGTKRTPTGVRLYVHRGGADP